MKYARFTDWMEDRGREGRVPVTRGKPTFRFELLAAGIFLSEAALADPNGRVGADQERYLPSLGKAAEFGPRKRRSRASSWSMSLVSHSQITSASQPMALIFSMLRASRPTVRASLVCQ